MKTQPREGFMPRTSVRNRTGVLAVTAALAALSACGGGGGGGGSEDGDGGGAGGGNANSPPAFGAVTFSTNQSIELSAQLSATDPDTDPLTFSKTGDPSGGSVTSFSSAGAFVRSEEHTSELQSLRHLV